jgi:hypothetical protein
MKLGRLPTGSEARVVVGEGAGAWVGVGRGEGVGCCPRGAEFVGDASVEVEVEVGDEDELRGLQRREFCLLTGTSGGAGTMGAGAAARAAMAWWWRAK